MTILSDTDVSGFIPRLYEASQKRISAQEKKQLYWMFNTIVTHLKAIEDEERFTNIRTHILQEFKSHGTNSHKCLIKWLCQSSIKLSNDKLYGPIISLKKIFKILDKPKCENAPQRSALSVVRDIDFEFHPLKHENSICKIVEHRKNLEKHLIDILILLDEWKKLAKTSTYPLTTPKNSLFTKTNEMIATLKQQSRDAQSFIADLNLVISQQTKTFKDYPWNEISDLISANSFSEYDGAYQLFDCLMQLIFGIHDLPTEYLNAKNNALEQINLNKVKEEKFVQVFHKDLKQSQFQEFKIINKMLKVSKTERARAVFDFISLINEGTFTNLTLNLDSTVDLIKYFGVENCQRITRLEFNIHPNMHPKPERLLNDLLKYFPKLKHLSLYDGHLNTPLEESIKKLTTLECLRLIDYTNRAWTDFPSELNSLRELELSHHTDDSKLNLGNLLKFKDLKKLKCTANHKDRNADIIQQLTQLESLHLLCNLDDLNFLTPLKNLKDLQIEGIFKQLKLTEYPSLTHLKIGNNVLSEEINLRNLPILHTLNLKNASCIIVKIDNLPKLKEVNLGNLDVNTSEFEKSKEISKLSFKNLHLSRNLQWIMDYPLEALNITDQAMSFANLELLKGLTKLRELRLDIYTCIFEELIDHLSLIPSLKKIIINKNWLSNHILEGFKDKGIEVVNSLGSYSSKANQFGNLIQ